MMREEAIEFIQRDLDGDLSIAEKQRLREWLRADPELQLVYERLQRVSDRLSNLPPVALPYSLVDAILPKLDGVPIEPVSQAVRTTDVTPTEPAAALEAIPRLKEKQEQEPNGKRPRWPAWTVRAASGVAAACLLLGVVVMANSGHPKEEPGASQGVTPQAQSVTAGSSSPVVETVTPAPKPKESSQSETASPPPKQKNTPVQDNVPQKQQPEKPTKPEGGSGGTKPKSSQDGRNDRATVAKSGFGREDTPRDRQEAIKRARVPAAKSDDQTRERFRESGKQEKNDRQKGADDKENKEKEKKQDQEDKKQKMENTAEERWVDRRFDLDVNRLFPLRDKP